VADAVVVAIVQLWAALTIVDGRVVNCVILAVHARSCEIVLNSVPNARPDDVAELVCVPVVFLVVADTRAGLLEVGLVAGHADATENGLADWADAVGDLVYDSPRRSCWA